MNEVTNRVRACQAFAGVHLHPGLRKPSILSFLALIRLELDLREDAETKRMRQQPRWIDVQIRRDKTTELTNVGLLDRDPVRCQSKTTSTPREGLEVNEELMDTAEELGGGIGGRRDCTRPAFTVALVLELVDAA